MRNEVSSHSEEDRDDHRLIEERERERSGSGHSSEPLMARFLPVVIGWWGVVGSDCGCAGRRGGGRGGREGWTLG